MSKTILVCSSCGHRMLQWAGRCPSCLAWDSIAESNPVAPGFEAVRLGDVSVDSEVRMASGVAEFDRVVGGGLVQGSVLLVAGEPGVGKSSLMLQVARGLEASGKRVLMALGEESLPQVAARAERLGGALGIRATPVIDVELLRFDMAGCDVMIIDSIQTMRHPQVGAEPGSPTQVRSCAATLAKAAKDHGVCLILIGHVTKDGAVAGPRVLEHMVDVVLTFEGDSAHALRSIRGVKNRFGPTSELGLFEMTSRGLAEIADPSGMFLSERDSSSPGSAVGCITEGRRAVALEVQGLTITSEATIPRRIAQGLESSRLALALAVLEKRAGITFSRHEVYASLMGGLRTQDPGIDLALVLSLASARIGKPIPEGLAAVGEVGLGGEVRSVSGMTLRARELTRLGYSRILLPKNAEEVEQAVVVRSVREAIAVIE